MNPNAEKSDRRNRDRLSNLENHAVFTPSLGMDDTFDYDQTFCGKRNRVFILDDRRVWMLKVGEENRKAYTSCVMIERNRPLTYRDVIQDMKGHFSYRDLAHLSNHNFLECFTKVDNGVYGAFFGS